MFIANQTRPDIMYATYYLARYCNSFDSRHYKELLRILNYLYNSQHIVLKYYKRRYHNNRQLILTSFCDSDHADKTLQLSSPSIMEYQKHLGIPFDYNCTKYIMSKRKSIELEISFDSYIVM